MTHLTLRSWVATKRAREQRISRGKLLLLGRVNWPLDPGSPFLELASLVAGGMYGDEVLGERLITEIGQVAQRECVVAANDATVKNDI